MNNGRILSTKIAGSSGVGIFNYFIDVNIIRLLSDWPAQPGDPKISEKMFSIFLSKIREIQLKGFEVMGEVITIENNYNEFSNAFVYIGDRWHDDRFEYHGMEKEIKDVLQS